MKASLVLAALALSITAAVSAQAQTAGGAPAHGGDFASRQSAILARLDQRMAAMSAMRNCVAGATTRADLKTCREQNRDAMKHSRKPA
jgi:hypothetical protein